MVRPSSLNIARYCSLSPALGERFGSRNAEAERGTAVDKMVCDWVRGYVPEMPTDPDARACCAWIEQNLNGWTLLVQEQVRVYDPETGALLTTGTPDIVAHRGDELWIIDLKKREQYWAGLLVDINDDLQTHAYALGAIGRTQAFCYRKSYLLFGDGEVDARTSGYFGREDWPAIYDAIRDIQLAPVKATKGEHCLKCYGREHCTAWLLPAYEGPSALEPFTKPQGLTQDNAGVALDVVQAMKKAVEAAESQLKEFAKREGGIVVGDRRWAVVQMPGRTAVDTAALERDGLLERYSKRGAPFEQFRWLRAKST